MVFDFPRYFSSYSSSSCCLDFFFGSGFSVIRAGFLVALVCSSSLVSNSSVAFDTTISLAVALVASSVADFSIFSISFKALMVSSRASNAEIFLVRLSRAVSLVELTPISPSSVKAKPPDACSSIDSVSCFISGSGVDSGTSEVVASFCFLLKICLLGNR